MKFSAQNKGGAHLITRSAIRLDSGFAGMTTQWRDNLYYAIAKAEGDGITPRKPNTVKTVIPAKAGIQELGLDDSYLISI